MIFANRAFLNRAFVRSWLTRSGVLPLLAIGLALGAMSASADVVIKSDPTWRAIAPVGNLQGRPIESVGGNWETDNPGWNSDFDYDDSNTAGWTQSRQSGPSMWVEGTVNTPSYYRKTFQIDGVPTWANIEVGTDDDAFIYVNGRLMHYDASGGAGSTPDVDVTAFLHPGENLIAVKAHDSFGASQSLYIDLDVTTSLSEDAQMAEFVTAGDTWKYLDDGSNQGTAWRESLFDDSSWSEAQAEFGYGDGDEATIVSFGDDPENKQITTYFRKQFQVDDASRIESLSLATLRDDGAVVYLNGERVYRSRLPINPTFATLATRSTGNTEEELFTGSLLDPIRLVDGVNVIAVEVHQASADSSDMSFDLALSGVVGREQIALTYFNEPAQAATEYEPGPEGRELGFVSVFEPIAGGNPLASAVTSGSSRTSPILSHRSVDATTTFDTVDLREWREVTIDMLVRVRGTNYEDSDFLRIYVTDGERTVSLFDEAGDTVETSGLERLGGDGYEAYSASIPDDWTMATLVIESFSNSGSDAERYDFDNIVFRGEVVPEPSGVALVMLGVLGLLFRRVRSDV